MKKVSYLLFGLFFLGHNIVLADIVIAYWDFGPTTLDYTEVVQTEKVVDVPTLTGMMTGTGYDTNGQPGVSFVDTEGMSHNYGQALAWKSGVDDGDQEWILNINLTGYEKLHIQWDYRSTLTGPSSATLDYRVGAEDWNIIDSVVLATDSIFHTYQNDLSSFSAINNQTTVQFRLSGFAGGRRGGTHRVDNLQLSVIPEPAVLSFIGFSGLVLLITRRCWA